MKKYSIIIFILVFLALIILLYSRSQTQKQSIPLATQTDSQGAVIVQVTPIDVSKTAKTWQFKILLNTHTVNLDQDLTKMVILRNSYGDIYTPISWEGDPLGGHHREGTLSFKPISPKPPEI